jgi:hypothetical protein
VDTFRKGASDPLDVVTVQEQLTIAQALNAIESDVQVCCIAMGIVQLLEIITIKKSNGASTTFKPQEIHPKTP